MHELMLALVMSGPIQCPPGYNAPPWRAETCRELEFLENSSRPIRDPYTHKELHWQPVTEVQW